MICNSNERHQLVYVRKNLEQFMLYTALYQFLNYRIFKVKTYSEYHKTYNAALKTYMPVVLLYYLNDWGYFFTLKHEVNIYLLRSW